jgi:hypothetical protein
MHRAAPQRAAQDKQETGRRVTSSEPGVRFVRRNETQKLKSLDGSA